MMLRSFPALFLFLLPSLAWAHVRVDSPNGGEVLQGQSIHTVLWVDTINHGSNVTYEVQFSEDGGSTWTTVVLDLPYTGGTSSYDWLVPDVDTTQGRIKVIMHVTSTTTYSDTSDANFTVNASYESYGAGTAVNGVTPLLEMHDVPTAGQSITAHASMAQVGAQAYVLVGSFRGNAVIQGVTILASPTIAQIASAVDPNGDVIVPGTLPIGFANRTLNVQVVILSAPNYSATQGVEFLVLP